MAETRNVSELSLNTLNALSYDALLQWLTNQFGVDAAEQVVRLRAHAGHEEPTASLVAALRKVVGDDELYAAMSSHNALRNKITSEPVQVDQYESVDFSDLLPDEQDIDGDGETNGSVNCG